MRACIHVHVGISLDLTSIHIDISLYKLYVVHTYVGMYTKHILYHVYIQYT